MPKCVSSAVAVPFMIESCVGGPVRRSGHIAGDVLAAARGEVPAEAVAENVGQAEGLLRHQTVMALRIGEHRSSTEQSPEAVVTWMADQSRPAIICG